MHRSMLANLAAALFLLVSGFVASADAVPPPTGTVSCNGLEGILSFLPTGLPTFVNPLPPYETRFRIEKATSSTCDSSGVTGGRFPITGVSLWFDGRTVAGETCADMLGTLDFRKAKLKVRWDGHNDHGRLQAIARSKAAVASAVYDDESKRLVIVTDPIVRGAFAGSTLTFRVTFGSGFESVCKNSDTTYLTIFIGYDAGSTIEAP
jgi:hypothetical protein